MSQFMHKPREIHWKAALRILTYIKRSSKGLLYKTYGHLQVKIFHILIMQRIKDIESLPLATTLMLEEIWLLGGVRSRVLCLVLVPKQSIGDVMWDDVGENLMWELGFSEVGSMPMYLAILSSTGGPGT